MWDWLSLHCPRHSESLADRAVQIWRRTLGPRRWHCHRPDLAPTVGLMRARHKTYKIVNRSLVVRLVHRHHGPLLPAFKCSPRSRELPRVSSQQPARLPQKPRTFSDIPFGIWKIASAKPAVQLRDTVL